MDYHFKFQVGMKANTIWNGLSKIFHSFIQIPVVSISCVHVIPLEPLYYDFINDRTLMNGRINIYRMLGRKSY